MKVGKIKVDLIDSMGSDLSVVNAARVSMAKESSWSNVCWSCDFSSMDWDDDICPQCGADNAGRKVSDGMQLAERDTKLIRYLATYKHWTPFSHPQVSFRIKAPIFVARQWFKHMVGITRNETSRRYVDEQPEFYMPEVWRSRPEGSVKQGSGGPLEGVDDDNASIWAAEVTETALMNYTNMLSVGVAPEQARMVLPQNMMTEWIETASLAAVCRSVKLRLDPHAQQETREVAEQIAALVEPMFPVSWSALMGVEQ